MAAPGGSRCVWRKIMKEFIRYVSLNVMGMIGLSCYILADTFFVAQAEGASGLAALNYGIPVYSIMYGIGLMLGIGGATRFSISQGKVKREQKEGKREDTSLSHVIFMGLAVSLCIWLVSLSGSGPLAGLLGAEGDTLTLTKTYIATIMWFAPFFILNNILIAFVRNDGNPKLAMIAMLVSSLSNILFDYIFMFPLKMGMFGAALATGSSPLVSILILAKHLRSGKCSFRFRRCRLSVPVMGNILACGFSALIAELASAVALITFNLVIVNLKGDTGVAAYGIVANIALVVTAIFTGVAQGIQPLVSRYYGSGDTEELNRVVMRGILTVLVSSVLIFAVLMVGMRGIIAVFDRDHDPAMREMAEQGMKLYFIGYFFAGTNIMAATVLSAAAKVKAAFVISNLRSWCLFVPAILLMSKLFAMRGVWCSFPVTEFLIFLISAPVLIHYMIRWYD